MSLKYLNLSGLEELWINIKNYILSKIPTKTSELTNDSGYLTSHQSLANYVDLNTTQTITAIKVITGGNQGKMLFKNPNYIKGDAVESDITISRLYFGNGASYATSNGILTFDITSSGNTSLELAALNNTASNSNRASLIITYDKSATRPRLLKSWGDFIPNSNDGYSLGNASNVWKECYSNVYYLGSTAFGDIVTHNANEFLTSHQSLSSCLKNSVANTQTIKSTAITRGTAPSNAQTFGISFTGNNSKYIGNIYGQYATDKSIYVGLYAYKGTTTSASDNVSIRVGFDASGNAYTYAPTPTTSDNSTQIATTAFVKAQGYLTSINAYLENNTARDANTIDKNGITYYNSNGPATSLGASSTDGALFTQFHNNKWIAQIAQDYRNGNLFTRGKNNNTWQAWKAVAYHGDNISKFTNDAGYLTSHQSLSNYVTINTAQDIEGNKNFKGLLTTIPNGTLWTITNKTTDDITFLGDNVIHIERRSSGNLTDLSGGAWGVAELGLGCFFFRVNNGTDIRYKNFAQNTVNRIPVVSGANRFINDVTPNADNTYSLGSSSLKWKTFNGINPGALSFPDLSAGVDISSYITDLTGASNINKYTPTVNGWISIGLSNADFIEFYIPSSLMGASFTKNTLNGSGLAFMPVIANKEVKIALKGSAVGWAKFFPNLGNV